METHAIRILGEPRQVIASQTRSDVSILVPMEKVDELRVKLWRGSVEVAELL